MFIFMFDFKSTLLVIFILILLRFSNPYSYLLRKSPLDHNFIFDHLFHFLLFSNAKGPFQSTHNCLIFLFFFSFLFLFLSFPFLSSYLLTHPKRPHLFLHFFLLLYFLQFLFFFCFFFPFPSPLLTHYTHLPSPPP